MMSKSVVFKTKCPHGRCHQRVERIQALHPIDFGQETLHVVKTAHVTRFREDRIAIHGIALNAIKRRGMPESLRTRAKPIDELASINVREPQWESSGVPNDVRDFKLVTGSRKGWSALRI